MKLLSIELDNIRSYRHQKVDFRDGISLFEGDIGSGKSSILNAIEFALFGLGDLRGSHIIRVGEKEAKAILDLEINGRPYIFGRTLKRRGDSVQQDSCYIVEDGVKTEYSITDMKKRVLQLLNFKEPPNPRSHSVIYRFAIFTPQEAMKEVLGKKPSDRKQTLRKAFGIEEYNIAVENSGSLVSEVKVDMRVLKQSETEIEEINSRIGEEVTSVTQLQEDVRTINIDIDELGKREKVLSKLLEGKQKEVEKYQKLSTDLKIQENNKNLKKPLIEDAKKELEQLEYNLEKSREAEKICEKLQPDYENLLKSRETRRELEPKKKEYDEAVHQIELEKQKIESERVTLLKTLEEKRRAREELNYQIEYTRNELEKLPELVGKEEKIEREISRLPELRKSESKLTGEISSQAQTRESRLGEKTNLSKEWQEIESIGVGAECPRCQQELSPKHFDLLKKKYSQEISEVDIQIGKIGFNLEKLEQEKEWLKNEIEDLEEKQVEAKKYALKIQDMSIKQKNLTELATKISNLEYETTNLSKMIESGNYALDHKKKLETCQETVQRLKNEAKTYTALKDTIEKLEENEVERQYLENKNLSKRRLELEKSKEDKQIEKEQLENNLKKIEKAIDELFEELKNYDNPEKEKEALQSQVLEVGKEIAGLNSLIKEYKHRIKRTKDRIEDLKKSRRRHQKNLEKSEEYGLIRRWLEEAFIPSVHSIEQNVLQRLHSDFNRLFKKWFKTLLESEDIEGYIDEDFTPIIDQSGYELEIDSLSGGEKTSVALAYRLALNTIVKQVTNTMESNLLILDEPTDGFSREQLYKMRDILHDLNCEQVIMVSHENELESVADHIYRVQKEGTVSRVIEP